MDPLADKLLLVSGVVVLSCNHAAYLGQIPLWLTGTILGRDLLILIGIGVVRLTTGKVKVRPRWGGKIATVLQMTVIIWILLGWDQGKIGGWYFEWALGAAICTGLSGMLYLCDGVRQLSVHPASGVIKN